MRGDLHVMYACCMHLHVYTCTVHAQCTGAHDLTPTFSRSTFGRCLPCTVLMYTYARCAVLQSSIDKVLQPVDKCIVLC